MQPNSLAGGCPKSDREAFEVHAASSQGAMSKAGLEKKKAKRPDDDSHKISRHPQWHRSTFAAIFKTPSLDV